MHPVIVGLDPGTTSAFAVISFDCKIIKIKSRRDYPMSEIISDIYEVGNPLIVGTDKKDVPSFIKEFSQKTGTIIYRPKYDTKKDEKRSVVKNLNFLDFVKNTHETDALASAIYAYNEYLPLIRKIFSYIEKNNKQELKDRLLEKVITESKIISEAAAELERKPVKKQIMPIELPPAIIRQELTKEQKQIKLLVDMVKNQRQEIKALNVENNDLRQKKVDINKETKKLISFKETRALYLQKQNNILKKEINAKESIIKKLDFFIGRVSSSVLLKKLKNLGSEEYNIKKEILRIEKNDILFVDDITVISDNVIEEITGKIKIIIYKTGTNKLLSDKFLLAESGLFEIYETKYFALVPKEKFDIEIEKLSKQNKKGNEFLKDIIEEYKRERFS